MAHHVFAFECKYRWPEETKRNKETRYLMEDQAKHLYIKVDWGP